MQTGKGGLIPNLLAASEEPIADLIKAQRDRRKTRQAIGLEFIKDLSDSDKIALQEKMNTWCQKKVVGLSKEKAFNMVLPEFRKSKSPADIDRDERALKLKDIIDVTSTSDYFEVYHFQKTGGTGTYAVDSSSFLWGVFYGFKIA